MVFALVLLVLLALSLLWNFLGLAGGLAPSGRGVRYAHSAGPRIEEVVVEDNDVADKLAVLEVNGIITSQVPEQGGYSMVDVIKAELRRAAEDPHVRAVVLKVDSPGGEVLASDEIYRALADFQKARHGKPVIVSMGNLAASGGYYVSSPCRWIVANEMTITGSIGVIMHGYNYRGLMDKVGLRPEVFKSGRYKDMLSGEREPDDITPKEREMVQALIDETFSRFKAVVAEGRGWANSQNSAEAGATLADDWADYADGRVLSGREALRHGFVDQLGNFEVAVARAKKIAGIASANLIEYHQRYDLSDFLHLFGQTQSRAATIKVDLGMELPKLQAGQPYFLSPTLLH